MEIALVAAVAQNGAIGIQGNLPWRISSDLKLFKSLTMGHVVLMGRQTFESIGKALPGRENIVISNSWTGNEAENIRVFSNLDSAFEILSKEGKTKVYVIGGGIIYNQTLNLASSLFITRVKTSIPEADTFFPVIQKDLWKQIAKNSFIQTNKDEYPFEFQIFKRIGQ